MMQSNEGKQQNGKDQRSLQKIRDTKGTFLAKDRNNMDLTEAEGIKKKWQEYTEELYRKDINTQITRMV